MNDLMKDGSIRKRSVFESKKIDNRTIMLDGQVYDANKTIRQSCNGCAFFYKNDKYSTYSYEECEAAGKLQNCLDLSIIWKIRSEND